MKDNDTLKQFQLLYEMIRKSRTRALQSVNYEQLNMFWQTGAFIDARLNDGSWGEKVVDQFVQWLREQEPGISGFDRRNIYRMREFFQSWNQVHWSHSPFGLQIVVSPTPQIEDTVYQKDRIGVTLLP